MVDLLNIVAPLLIIVGALLTSLNAGNRITGSGFVAFTLGSLAWLAIGLLAGPGALVWQNVVLSALNAFGIWRWLGRERAIEIGAETAQRKSSALPGSDLVAASTVVGGAVLGRGGIKLGDAVDATVECDTGRLRYLVVSEGGVAGVGERLRRVEWNDARFDGESIRTDHDSRSFSDLPELDRKDWPGR